MDRIIIPEKPVSQPPSLYTRCQPTYHSNLAQLMVLADQTDLNITNYSQLHEQSIFSAMHDQ